MDLPELIPGMLIGANVRLVSLLGEGGMGSVWVADHLSLKTKVAVKFLSPALTKDRASNERFAREATAAAQIKSPHVVQIFDHGLFAGGIPYIVMELLEGEDLSQRLEHRGPLPLGELTRVVVQVCRALAKAHKVEIVHRDIKPDNIFLIDQDGELFVKVLDFGIAKSLKEETSMTLTATGAMVGTPYYMSPEQMLSSKHIDFRADLWSLGVVAYHCLTGHVPFEGETLGGLCVAIEKGVFVPPSHSLPGLVPEVDAWFARALHREPAARFGSAREMADALVEVTGRLPAGALGATISASPREYAPSLPDGALEGWRAAMATPPAEGWRAAMATPPVVTAKTMPNFGLPTDVSPPGRPRRSQRSAALWGALAGGVLVAAGVGAFVVVSARSPQPSSPGHDLGAPAATPPAVSLDAIGLPAPSSPSPAADPSPGAAALSASAPAPSASAAWAPRPAASTRKLPLPPTPLRPRPTPSFRPSPEGPATVEAPPNEGALTPPPIGIPGASAAPKAPPSTPPGDPSSEPD